MYSYDGGQLKIENEKLKIVVFLNPSGIQK
jgi:hypothetical protein